MFVWFPSPQEVNYKTHKASKVLILGNMKMLLTTGTSRWNDRQIVLWDQVRASEWVFFFFFFNEIQLKNVYVSAALLSLKFSYGGCIKGCFLERL